MTTIEESKQNREALVAIIGEPNVGKSTLLNKITARRQALVSKIAGTTRDRFYAPSSWNGVDFLLIDTAGIVLEQRDELERNVQKQVEIALAECDLILYVIDGKRDPESIDRRILGLLRKKKKPVVLAINKIDSPKKIDQTVGEYQFTGIKEIFAISAVSGSGIGDMLDAVAANLQAAGFGTIPEKDPNVIAVSILGKPNVGKSSLFNKIIGAERVVVSELPGTTRNSIDTDITFDERKIRLVDTAGLKRREKRAPLPDIYAALQTVRSLRHSEIAILVIDAKEGISQQDQRVAGEIVDASKGLVVAVNKIDLLSSTARTELQRNLEHYFPFLWWSPVVPISAKTGEGVNDVLKYILEIDANRRKEVDSQLLNEFFQRQLKLRQPQRIKDERVPKVFSLQQVAANPPVFEMTVNKASAIAPQFRKFIQKAIIKELGFWGTPIVLRLRPKVGNPNQPALI